MNVKRKKQKNFFLLKNRLTFKKGLDKLSLLRMITDKKKMFRNTKQKSYILEAIYSLCHPTAKEVYVYVKTKCPSISKGTVYRALSSLTQAGKVHHIKVPNGADCYDWNCKNHYHLACCKCGKICDIDVPYAAHFNYVPLNGAFIISHTALFYGECPHCYHQGIKENKT